MVSIVILDEFLIALGVKADTAKLKEFEKGLDDVSDAADDTESSMLKAYDATDSFVSEIGKAMGIITFFTGILGGALGAFHSTIMGLEELIEEEKLLHKVTKDQLEQQKKYKESVETLGKRFQSLKVELAFGFLPTLQNMVTKLDEFLAKNKDLIVNGITAFLNAISRVVQVGVNFVRFLDRVIGGTIGWKNFLIGLVGALLLFKRAVILAFATSPLGLFLIALGAIMLLVDDFMTYMDGGDSLFGEYWGAMLGWIEENKDALNALKDIFVNVINVMVGIFAMLVGIFTGDTALMSAAWEGMIESFIAAWNGLAMFFEPAAQWITDTINNAFESAKNFVLNILNQIVSAIAGFVSRIGAAMLGVYAVVTAPFKAAFDWIVDKFSQLPSIIGGITSRLTFGLSDKVVGAVSSIRNSVSSSTTNVQASINVNGAGNPQAVGNAVGANINSLAKSNTGGAALA